MWTFIQVVLSLIWFACIPAFVVFWWKKRKARIAAGENYKNDAMYKKMSAIKRGIGIVFFGIFIFMGIIVPELDTANKSSENVTSTENLEIAKNDSDENKKIEQEKLAAEKAEQERIVDEKIRRQKEELKQNFERIKSQAGDKAKEIKDIVVEKAADYANKTLEDLKNEAKEFTADEIFVCKMKNFLSGEDIADTEIYILPKTVEPLMDGIIFETREGFTIKVKVKINGVDGYLMKYYFYNHNNFFESEDKVYFSEWEQKYYGDEDHFIGNDRQHHITEDVNALAIYRASKKFSLIR